MDILLKYMYKMLNFSRRNLVGFKCLWSVKVSFKDENTYVDFDAWQAQRCFYAEKETRGVTK